MTIVSAKVFLLGSDLSQRKYTEWMLQQLQKVNSQIEVLVADFESGKLSDLPAKTFVVQNADSVQGWFKKPFAIDQAHALGYTEVCWLDNDLEIIENIDSIFEYSVLDKLGLAPDGYAIKRTPQTVWNSGVVLSHSRPAVLTDWMQRCLRQKDRGDQEALAAIADGNQKLRNQIFDLPVVFNWLRLMGEPKQSVKIRHWTGPAGKRHIRENLWK
jgi:hypothetical protein